MITRFYMESFKSYRKAALPLAPLTLLIGANASGKSNALEGLRMLARMAKGTYLSDIFQILQKDQSIRGSLNDLIYARQDTFALGCSLEKTVAWPDLYTKIRYDSKELVVVEESVNAEQATFPLYRVESPAAAYAHELKVTYNNFSRGGIKPQVTCDNRQAIFTQLTTPARFSTPKAQEQIPQATQTFRQALDQILFLDPIPRRMRGYSFVTDRDLQEDGANLSSVLFDLCEQRGQREHVLDFIQSLPEQDIRGIEFVQTPRNEVMVQLTESFGGLVQSRDAVTLSDGTLRVLAVVAALLSAPPDSMVVIEEIDNGVHPSRAHLLLKNIQQVADEQGLCVLLTTHNPALLDALPLKAIPDVVCCYRDLHEGDSRLIRLEDLPDYPELIALGPVGSLMTRGILDRYLKRHPRSQEQRMAEATAWLETLQAQDIYQEVTE